MAKKILFLSTRMHGTLHRNLQKHSSNEIFYTTYKDLTFEIKPGKVEIYDTRNNLFLEQYELVYFKQYSVETNACVVFLLEKGISFLNKDLAFNFIYNKLAQYVKLGLGGLLIPDSFYGSSTQLLKAAKQMQFPIILKSIESSLGKDNFLIKNYEELENVLENNKKKSFVIQKYIPNSFDYRVLILGGQLGTVLKRIRQNADDHRNNTALGAIEEEIASPPQEMIDLSVKVANLLGKDIAGVDLIFDEDTKQYFIIESNSKPCFTNDTLVSSEVPQFTKYIDSVVG